MTTSVTDSTHPYYDCVSKLNPLEAVNFFKKHPERMKHVSLGEMLDFTSGGGMNYVFWDMHIKGVVEFVDLWMKNQEPRIHFKRIPVSESSYTFKEEFREEGYVWNRFGRDFDQSLPFVHMEKCPVEGHQDKGKDVAGRTRCINRLHRDKAGTKSDFCYTVLDDVGIYLPLENILTRLDVSSSHDNLNSVFPFSGFSLAGYVKAWYNQTGNKRFFMSPVETENYRVVRDFQFVNSED